jgi:hypothetical protein
MDKTVAAGFEDKPAETVVAGFKAQPRNLRSSSPHARCRPHTAPPGLSIAWPPNTQPSPVLYTRFLLLPQSSSLHAMPHLPPAHHETSKRDSPNKTKIKEKQNKTIPDLNSNLTKSVTHHNQTK